jgi:hypothetical protein
LVDDDNLCAAVLGDCLAVISCTDRPPVVLTDGTVRTLDRVAQNLTGQARLYRLREHRALANRPEGYWSYGDAVEAAQHVLCASIPIRSVRALLLCSDGLLRDASLRSLLREPAQTDVAPQMLRALAESVRTRAFVGAAQDDEAAAFVSRRNF